MRIRPSHALFVLALVSVPAAARGGGGGALGDAMVYLMAVAIVVGVPTGLAMAYVKWMRMLVPSLVVFGAIAIVTTQRWAPWFFGIPLATFAAVGASAFLWARDSETTFLPDAARWIAGTHLFWTVFSLVNVKVLGVFALPPLLFFAGKFLLKFMPFVLPPFALALAISVFAARIVFSRRSDLGTRARPMIFNGILLVAFLASGEVYKTILIQMQLSGEHPDCVSSRPFLSALSRAGDWFRSSNGYFEEAGKRYHWSYSERRFVDAPKYALACKPGSHRP